MPLFKLDLTGVSGKNIIVSGLQTQIGMSSSGKTTAFGAVIPLVRIQPSQLKKTDFLSPGNPETWECF